MAVSPNTDFVSGQILTAAQQNNFPRGVMGRAVATTSQSFNTGSAVDFTSLSITFTAVANRYYKLSFSLPSVTGSASNRFVTVIRDGANTELLAAYNEVTSLGYSICNYTTQTFTAGSKTVKLSAYRDSGSNAIQSFGGATSPMELTVEDMGPA